MDRKADDEYYEDAKDLHSVTSPAAPAVPQAPIDIDDEIAQYDKEGQGLVVDEETSRRLRKMIDKRVLVIMVGTYLCQSMDKNLISLSGVMGIKTDNNLQGQEFSWLTTIVYLGILVFEFPTNYALQRFPMAKYIAFCIFGWGTVICCTAACSNFAGLMTVRFLLGALECVCQPAFTLLSAMWYKREEQTRTISLWYCMNGLQQMVGGVIAYGVQHIGRDGALKPWQALFLILGFVTVIWAIFVLYWLPDSPMRAKCFSHEDKVLMVERVKGNQTGIQNKKFKREQAVEALLDPITWCIVLLQLLNTLPTGGIGAYSSILINSFGYTTEQTLLLTIGQGAVIIAVLLSAAWFATKTNQTILVMIVYTFPNIAASIVFMTVEVNNSTKRGLLVAFYTCMFFNGIAVLIFSLVSRNVAGQTKKSIVLTCSFVAWCTGNMIGPQVFQAKWEPHSYYPTWIIHLICYCCQIGVLVVLRVYLMRQNALKRRASDKGDGAVDEEEKVSEEFAFADLTDKQNPHFRYQY